MGPQYGGRTAGGPVLPWSRAPGRTDIKAQGSRKGLEGKYGNTEKRGRKGREGKEMGEREGTGEGREG